MPRIIYLILISCTVFLQGCFDIIEQLYVKDDASGNYQLTLNLSRSKTRINSFIKMKTVNGHKVPSRDEISRKLKEVEGKVASTPGLSAVKTSIDFDNYIITLNCNFKDVKQLNAAIRNNDETSGKVAEARAKSFGYDAAAKLFSRFNKFPVRESYNKMSNADKEIFSTATYTSVYRFDSPVIVQSNPDSKLSPSKKAVMIKLNILDIISGKKSFENTIKLTK